MVLFPAFRLQDRMQKVTFGQVRVCERGVPLLRAYGFTERSVWQRKGTRSLPNSTCCVVLYTFALSDDILPLYVNANRSIKHVGETTLPCPSGRSVAMGIDSKSARERKAIRRVSFVCGGGPGGPV